MRRKDVFFVFSIVLLLFASAAQAQMSPNSSPLAGEPRLFGPGVISTSDYEFNASFTPDANTVYFSKSDVAFNRITIVLSHRRNGMWSQPEVAPFSGIWKDTDPSVSPDGKRLFFSSTRPTDGGSVPRKDYDLWYVELTSGNVWGEPKHLGPTVNSNDSELYPSVARDGTLYFCATRSDHPGAHLYRSRLVNGEYANPELLPFSSQANDLDGTIAADDSFIVFISRDRGGVGAGDVFVSFHRTDGTWSAPVNLGAPINSASQEIATGLSPDNRTLYFASNRINIPPVRPARVDYQQLEQELHSIQNGLLNIYEVDISDLNRLAPGHEPEGKEHSQTPSSGPAVGQTADYYLTPKLRPGEQFSNIFSRAISYQAEGIDEIVRRVSGTATYTVKESSDRKLVFDGQFRYDGRTEARGETELRDHGRTTCWEGKYSPTSDASGLLYNPLLWGEQQGDLREGVMWTVPISDPSELGPHGKQTVTVMSVDPGNHSITLKREGTGEGYFAGDARQIQITKEGKTYKVDVSPGPSHWSGYTVFRQGIVISDELLVERPVTFSSKETGTIQGRERQYILLNAMPNPTSDHGK